MAFPDDFGENGDILKSLHDQLRLTKYLAVVSFTLILYDWVSTLDLEVEFIWGTRWSLGRFTYHMNRIWPIILLGTTLPEILFVSSSSPLVSNVLKCG
ncbi:unnamed protein product [Rhizoctonia solani]|uniref:DUF6533 domain-containing protein n=1 Tax=Rhizoctonia solani TaxID=456999 RepID=A0A8H3CWJ4_9AGAM|nr:unnamed protein product [Rhizoctonia solani]